MKKFLLFLASAAFIFAACNIINPDPDPEPEPEPEPVEEGEPIEIDGEFDDWAKLDQSKVAIAKNNADSPWSYVKQMRVYANEGYVYYYIEFDNAELKEQMAIYDDEHSGLPMRINLNIDGEFASGYANYSLDHYDFIIEGALTEKGQWTSFDGTLHQRTSGWNELLKVGSGLCIGAGNGNKYEICLDRAVFDRVEKLEGQPNAIGNVFHTGLRFYTADWSSELSNMPNAAITEDNSHGWGHLLEVTTVKE